MYCKFSSHLIIVIYSLISSLTFWLIFVFLYFRFGASFLMVGLWFSGLVAFAFVGAQDWLPSCFISFLNRDDPLFTVVPRRLLPTLSCVKEGWSPSKNQYMKEHEKGWQPFGPAGGKFSIFLSESPRLSRVRFSRKNFRFKLPPGQTLIKFKFFGKIWRLKYLRPSLQCVCSCCENNLMRHFCLGRTNSSVLGIMVTYRL